MLNVQTSLTNTQTHISPAEQSFAGVSEIMIPSNSLHDFELVLPMLAHLSRKTEDRWMTCIGNSILNKSYIDEYGFNSKCVRLIHGQDIEEVLWTFWETLNNGTSAHVVAKIHTDSQSSIRKSEMDKLNFAARSGNCRGLLLNVFNSPFM